MNRANQNHETNKWVSWLERMSIVNQKNQYGDSSQSVSWIKRISIVTRANQFKPTKQISPHFYKTPNFVQAAVTHLATSNTHLFSLICTSCPSRAMIWANTCWYLLKMSFRKAYMYIWWVQKVIIYIHTQNRETHTCRSFQEQNNVPYKRDLKDTWEHPILQSAGDCHWAAAGRVYPDRRCWSTTRSPPPARQQEKRKKLMCCW